MKKILTLALFCILLTGCSQFRIHKMDIVQGNVYTQEEVNSLRIGMSTGEVKNILGNPVMVNVLANNRIDYVYTNQPGHQDMSVKHLACTFQSGRLVSVKQG